MYLACIKTQARHSPHTHPPHSYTQNRYTHTAYCKLLLKTKTGSVDKEVQRLHDMQARGMVLQDINYSLVAQIAADKGDVVGRLCVGGGEGLVICCICG